ncbi:hypothetical protein KKF60_03235 [Patescibacteria group bacterium]|nr:hypothetical protein [Patescibacteria group bacterium]MBU4458881.1 hypothetical protein [Patescibacteria group bacterium]MCG2696163.1 hypothetical protein [Candidatus Portnoybacteria bacterium]
MTVLQLFKEKMLGINQFVRAKKTMMAYGQELFVKGQPYRITKVNADGITIKGKSRNNCQFIAKPKLGAKNLFSWTNFKLIGKNRKGLTRAMKAAS